MEIKNPIIPGFYPDPSIIRVEDDFFMVHSSFEYFPAIPLWHSRDLKHWRQLGHVIDRDSQGLDLSHVASSGGVQAATIRHHNGTFYVTSTRVNTAWPADHYHFVTTTQDIFGSFGPCHFIQGAYGIDSALFFEHDRAYFLANRAKPGSDDPSDAEIWMQELDLTTFKLLGDAHPLWAGTGGIFPEGPRLFKRDGRYYLLIAEGGTLHHHTVTVASSTDLWGPYEASPRNPILTHKHLSRTYPIQNVGHADLVDLPNGETVGVCLGSRPRGGFYDGGNTVHTFGGYYRNLGRETFIFPVEWPNDPHGPLFSPATGKIESSYELSGIQETPVNDGSVGFHKASLKTKWAVIKQTAMPHVVMGNDILNLTLTKDLESSFIGTRQTAWQGRINVMADVKDMRGGTFVFTAWISEASYMGLSIHQQTLEFFSVFKHEKTIHKAVSVERTQFSLKLDMDDQAYTFSVDETHRITLDGRRISCDLNDAHTGVMIGFTGISSQSECVTLSEFTYQTQG